MKKVVVFSVILFILAGFYIWQGIYVPGYPVSTLHNYFSIQRGQGLSEIAANLENEGLVKNRLFFIVYGILSGQSKRLKAGAYEIDSSMNIPEITGVFVAGDSVKIRITVPEGWTVADIGEYLESRKIIERGKDFYGANSPLVYKDFSSDYDFLKDKPKNNSLEGYFFPDTYEISGGEGVEEEIAGKMLDNFGEKLDVKLREEIAEQDKTIFDIVRMASLLEKEVKTKEDKEIVSGILWKRIKIGMFLQVDASISYITGNKSVDVSVEDTRIDSPYNTYKYEGLPAGPICNPGLESIKAAIYPKESDYFYYLSAADGTTIFSKTLKEHNMAKIKYL